MNKAITDGIVFMPLPYSAGLGVWSSGDGTPGSDTYAVSGNGVFVAADQDFAGCLEIQKSDSLTKLRYMGETPILPGCYLKVTARIKAVAGPLPTVRIAAWAAAPGGTHLAGVTEVGQSTQLTTYGEVVEVSAIVASGDRNGVDMVWAGASYGHFGIDLTGPTGGLVRVDDITIEDATGVFLRDMLPIVDVRDYGALGDGSTDDSAAFEAADAAANGREVLVPEGVYFLGNDVTMESRVQFEGTVTQPAVKRFILQQHFDYDSYRSAFGDETTAFQKAFQALLNYSDHESLDLCGRRIGLSEPLDMQACDPLRTTFATRRVIRNGQFEAVGTTPWETDIVTSQGTYSTSNPDNLTNVVNIANVQIGSLVEGTGVGREIYVTDVNVGQQRVTLSQPLYDAAGTQTFTFKRFKYLLDFSGFNSLSKFVIDDIELQCNGKASGILIAPDGINFQIRDCFITKPKDRGVTSHARGCQGMMIDRTQFLSNETSLNVQDRTSVAFNCNANDLKLRDNRVMMFKHFCVIAGLTSIISGNHWFHGDTATEGVRKGGIIFTSPNPATIITGNYIDNNFIEWTNEHSQEPALGNQFSFGGMTITGNVFFAKDVGAWFKFIVIKPYGPGHFIHGLSVVSNVFRTANGFIDRVEKVDTTFADLNYSRMRAVSFIANTFHGVTDEVHNPAHLTHTENTASSVWTAETAPYLPFQGRARYVDAVVADGTLRTSNNSNRYLAPGVNASQGSDGRDVDFHWSEPVKGSIRYTVRMDNPN